MRLEQVMVVNVVTISPSERLSVAADWMRGQNVGCLVVTNAGEVKGIITDRDIATRCVSREHDARGCCVSDHMSAPPITAHPSMDIIEAAHLMRAAQIKRLPIVSGSQLIGLVSLSDVALALDQPMHDLLLGMGAARRGE